MEKIKVVKTVVCMVFAGLFLFWSIAGAEESESGKSFMDVLKEVAGQAANEALNDQIDELKGTFAGEITDIRLIERRGRSAIFEVSYKDVKDTSGLNLVGEVLRGGSPSDSFERSTADIGAKRGTLRLMFEKGAAAADEGWGIETDAGEVRTDQIRLTFVRNTHPDEPFGQYLFNFNKTWTASNEPDVIEEQAAKDESVSLADGEQTTPPPVLVRPGTSIKPAVVTKQVSVAASGTGAAQSSAQAPTQSTTNPTAIPPKRMGPIHAFQRLMLNEYASEAVWQSDAGKLVFPGSPRDRQGYVRIIPEAKLSTGNMAADLLNTHPQWKARGYIQGTYPRMKLGNSMHLKTVIGFLQGADESDGVRFSVSIEADGQTRRIYAKGLTPKRYENVDIDLSRWAGKVVRIILRVDAGSNSRQDYAVWVKPRLDVVP